MGESHLLFEQVFLNPGYRDPFLDHFRGRPERASHRSCRGGVDHLGILSAIGDLPSDCVREFYHESLLRKPIYSQTTIDDGLHTMFLILQYDFVQAPALSPCQIIDREMLIRLGKIPASLVGEMPKVNAGRIRQGVDYLSSGCLHHTFSLVHEILLSSPRPFHILSAMMKC